VHLILISTFLVLGNLTLAPLEWKGRVEIKEGVLHVYNPQQGLWDNDPTKKLTFEKVLSIGSMTAEDEYLFSWVQDITTDLEGYIYACDSQEHRIQVYDKSGQFVRTVGREGQGPGELLRPMAVRVTPDGSVFVQDHLNYRISIFKPDGKFDHSFRYESFAKEALEIDPDGRVFLIHPFLGDTKARSALHIVTGYNLKGKIEKEFGEPLLLLEKDGYGKPFFDSNGFVLLSNGVLLVDFKSSYRLQFYQEERLIKVVSRESDIFTKPENIETIFRASSGEGGKLKATMSRSQIWEVFPLPSNRLAVFIQDRGKDYKEKTIGGRDFVTVIDLFDSDGKFLNSYAWDWLNLGLIKHVDNEGYFYTNRGDSEIVPGVTKWRVAFD